MSIFTVVSMYSGLSYIEVAVCTSLSFDTIEAAKARWCMFASSGDVPYSIVIGYGESGWSCAR
jgi:hypothetical protein